MWWLALLGVCIAGLLLPNWLHTRRAELRDRYDQYDPDLLPMPAAPGVRPSGAWRRLGKAGRVPVARPADHPNTHQEQHP